MAHHNVLYRWSDRELQSFEVQEWIYDGTWKLAADLAPSGGIHSCTSESHNLQMETSERYGITQRFEIRRRSVMFVSCRERATTIFVLKRRIYSCIPNLLLFWGIMLGSCEAEYTLKLSNRRNNLPYFCVQPSITITSSLWTLFYWYVIF